MTSNFNKAIDPTPISRWKMCFNGDWKFVIYHAEAPNKFHRFMQRVLLGIHWASLQDDEFKKM